MRCAFLVLAAACVLRATPANASFLLEEVHGDIPGQVVHPLPGLDLLRSTNVVLASRWCAELSDVGLMIDVHDRRRHVVEVRSVELRRRANGRIVHRRSLRITGHAVRAGGRVAAGAASVAIPARTGPRRYVVHALVETVVVPAMRHELELAFDVVIDRVRVQVVLPFGIGRT